MERLFLTKTERNLREADSLVKGVLSDLRTGAIIFSEPDIRIRVLFAYEYAKLISGDMNVYKLIDGIEDYYLDYLQRDPNGIAVTQQVLNDTQSAANDLYYACLHENLEHLGVSLASGLSPRPTTLREKVLKYLGI